MPGPGPVAGVHTPPLASVIDDTENPLMVTCAAAPEPGLAPNATVSVSVGKYPVPGFMRFTATTMPFSTTATAVAPMPVPPLIVTVGGEPYPVPPSVTVIFGETFPWPTNKVPSNVQ